MDTVTFKGKTYKVTETHAVPALLAAEGLQAQMTIAGPRGATRLLQVWETRLGLVYKTIATNANIETELK